MAVNAKEVASAVRGWVDYILGWALWLAVAALMILFIGYVARTFGYAIPMIPKVDVQPLTWAAGFVYLIGKRG